MSKSVYAVHVMPSAYRDLERQLLWLLNNRGRTQADQLDRAVSNCLESLEKMPERWQRLNRPREHIRRAIVLKRYLLFYKIDNPIKKVDVIAFRGAAEDWTSQPLPTD